MRSCCFVAISGSVSYILTIGIHIFHILNKLWKETVRPPCLSMLSQRLWKFCLKLLTTTVSHSWYGGHDFVVRSQGNPSVPLLPGSTMRPVDRNMVQLQAVLAFRWILAMNLPSHHFSCSSSCTDICINYIAGYGDYRNFDLLGVMTEREHNVTTNFGFETNPK